MSDTNSTKNLEKYLKELRKSCNYSQEFVASHLNITRQTYSHYETGRITPPINSLYNLAKLYGVPIENFLELVVTYHIDTDYAYKPVQLPQATVDETSLFLGYMQKSENEKKFKNLNRQEKRLLYYFLHIDTRDQEDILDYLKLKFYKTIEKENLK